MLCVFYIEMQTGECCFVGMIGYYANRFLLLVANSNISMDYSLNM